MKVTAGKVDGFISQLSPSLLGALVYGPDNGLVSQRANIIAKHIVGDKIDDPFLVSDISPDRLSDDSSILMDELSAVSMMGGRRLVRIRHVPTGMASLFKKTLDEIDEQTASDVFLLVTAGELGASSGLRGLFEKHQQLAALPCYQDDARGLFSIASEALKTASLPVSREIVACLVEHCQGDRLMVKNAVEKLSLYMGDTPEALTLDDVRQCVGDATESTLDDVCYAVTGGNTTLTIKHLHKALSQGIMPVVILRSVQRHLERLHLVSGGMAHGKNQEQAMSALRPPVFYKQLPTFRQHAQQFSRMAQPHIWNMLGMIRNAEYAVKQTGANPDLLCERALMQVSRRIMSAR